MNNRQVKYLLSKMPLSAWRKGFYKNYTKNLVKIFIYENKIIYSRVETFNLNIYTHEKCV